MNRTRVWAIVAGGLAGLALCAGRAAGKGCAREPAVAGAFYPRSPDALRETVDTMLEQAAPPRIEGRVRALMVPHAGYVYSGSVAAWGFKTLQGRKYRTVVLIGNSHHEAFDGASVFAEGVFRTPLGDVEIDEGFAKRLLDADPRMTFRGSPQGPEHSLEVEVPFLQRVLGEFKLVPILLGGESLDLSRMLANALSRVADDGTLVVTSTDMSHYPAWEDANFADRKVAEAIVTGDAEHLERTIRQLERSGVPNAVTFLCGEGAVKAAMLYAKDAGAQDIRLLRYANSGDTAGSKARVVGYAAIAFAAQPAAPAEEGLKREERDALLELARLTVETFVRTGQRPDWTNRLPALEQPLGAFVTLKKHGELRGCIGRFQPQTPLREVVGEMAVAAATQDHRFPPVSQEELGELEYEISVLSPLRKVGSWREIELGRHGVQVVRGFRSGVFLPQVAAETGWGLETFMNNLCAHKAGLPADAWKDPKTEIYVFTAQVFPGTRH